MQDLLISKDKLESRKDLESDMKMDALILSHEEMGDKKALFDFQVFSNPKKKEVVKSSAEKIILASQILRFLFSIELERSRLLIHNAKDV